MRTRTKEKKLTVGPNNAVIVWATSQSFVSGLVWGAIRVPIWAYQTFVYPTTPSSFSIVCCLIVSLSSACSQLLTVIQTLQAGACSGGMMWGVGCRVQGLSEWILLIEVNKVD